MNAKSCPNCGAPIKAGKSKCEYCDTVFEEKQAAYTTSDKFKVLAVVRINDEELRMMNADAAEQHVKKLLAKQILEHVLRNMQVHSEFDCMSFQTIYTGRVKF